ncbi:MAG TPA: ATP-binding protein, partial [Candidatus Limnocylindria bacterium]|nr:ATP-binding protein [Candidatus Limnocylindria bacterium]
DFNNILTVIHCNASLLLDTTGGPGSEGTVLARQIIESAERAAGLTRQLLLFGRKQAMEMADLDLRAIVQNMALMLRRLLGEDIVLVADCVPDLPLIRGDNTMVEQVLLNLVVNSRDAMPGGGRLTLATSLVTHDAANPPPSAEVGPGTFVRLSVTDTGTGIAAEHLPRIFEPFFTTKEVGKGTGLGLATVYGIVKQHRGWIELQSTVGEGTTFHVHFPVADRPVAARPVVAPANELPRGSEVILVVEDEPALRALAKLVLQRCGYTVLEAASGVAALKVWAAHREQIRLLLTDMVMPDGMTGRELAARLQTEDPALRVILTSGYSPDAAETAAIGFLAKPYSPIKLARVVRESLDRK